MREFDGETMSEFIFREVQKYENPYLFQYVLVDGSCFYHVSTRQTGNGATVHCHVHVIGLSLAVLTEKVR